MVCLLKWYCLIWSGLIFICADAKDGPLDTSPNSSPLPKLDDKIAASFPTGKPHQEDLLETVVCKHCKRPVLKSTASEHIRGCLKAKQEKARKKKEARDAANRAKAGDDDDVRDKADIGDDVMTGQKSAKKSAVKATEDNRKGKKRKADEDDKEPKKKKKKDEPKAKSTKAKGPVDVEKQCGVTLPNGAQCARSLTCKSHSMGAKRAVPGRSLPYDMLLQQYQKKNQARQQSMIFLETNQRVQIANDSYRGCHRCQRATAGGHRDQWPSRLRRGAGLSHGCYRALHAKAFGRTHPDQFQIKVPLCAYQGTDASRHWWTRRRRPLFHRRQPFLVWKYLPTLQSQHGHILFSNASRHRISGCRRVQKNPSTGRAQNSHGDDLVRCMQLVMT